MSQRQAILGFTEAELGFFLVFALLIVFLMGRRKPAPSDPPVAITQSALDSLHHVIDSIQSVNRSLQARLDSVPVNPSSLTPLCSEKGATPGLRIVLTYLGHGEYLLEDRGLSLDEFRARFRLEFAEALRRRCKHQVVLKSSPTVGANDLIGATEALRAMPLYINLHKSGS